MEKVGRGKVMEHNSIEVLVDSDAFVGAMLEKDAHYKEAKTIFETLKERSTQIVTTSAVIGETATVLSHRVGQEIANNFLNATTTLGGIAVVHVDEELHQAALNIFMKQQTKGTSYVDCVNVVVCRKFNIPHIFGFDKAYPKYFGIELLQI